MKIKLCELDETKECTNCNDCDRCDLNSEKLCDNCMKCLDMDEKDYKEIIVEGVLDKDEADDYLYDEVTGKCELGDDKDLLDPMIFIEDIPELKKEYDEKISSLLTGKGREVE